MTSEKKFKKFLALINRLVFDLRRNNTLQVQGNVNQFFYLQKIAELETLKERLDEAEKRAVFMREAFETHYTELYQRWSKDVRWLNKHLNVREGVDQYQP